LTEIRLEDHAELKRFYGFTSGGLMMEAFDLHSAPAVPDVLAQEYQQQGFKKKKTIYSLLEEGELKAIIIVDVTDIGLNMTPRFSVETTLAYVSKEYEHQEMPVLMYPLAYAEKHSLPMEKSYVLCIMNLYYIDLFLKYCDNIFHPFKNSPESNIADGAMEAFHV
jgi:hypothetical protein